MCFPLFYCLYGFLISRYSIGLILAELSCFLEFGEVVTIGSIFGMSSDDAEGF